LQERPDRPVIKRGTTVRHPLHPWSPAVHALLGHLRAVGFTPAPRVLGVEDGWEVFEYLEGESGPDGWAKVVDPAGLRAAGRLLRDYHQAVAEWAPPEPPVWFDGSTGTGGPGEVVCHGDFGPWNLVWQGLRPTGLIDWEYAAPGPASYDVFYAMQYVVPFRDDEECVRWLRYPSPPDRKARAEIFATAYGLDSLDGLVDEVIAVELQGLDTVRRLAADGHPRQVAALSDGLAETVRRNVAWAEANRESFS
jgi:Phosphotransferase enzyme family